MYIAGMFGFHRLLSYRYVFSSWYEHTGTSEAGQWGYGQILALFAWGPTFWGLGTIVVEILGIWKAV
jgi:hypothetical protein